MPGQSWYKPHWKEVSCSELRLEDKELEEAISAFHFELLDPMSLTPRGLEEVIAGGDDISVLEKFMPKIVRNHNFTNPETGEPLPQFQEDKDAIKELPMFMIRFISDKFLEMVNPEREIVPLVKEKA